MNKRIKELSDIALELTYIDMRKDDYPDERKTRWYRDDIFKEKFAELIIEDCLDTISYGGEYVNRVKLVEQLKSHFGME